MKWNILHQDVPRSSLEVRELLLANRGLTSETTQDFFAPKHPSLLTLQDVSIDSEQMAKAVERILLAKEQKEEVVVFGDYDADGVCATAILWETLFELGLKAIPFIPHREKHGYGMTDRSLDALLAERKPSLIITVDNGIVALAAVDRLNQEGIDVIITDHHMPERKITNSKLQIANSDTSLPNNPTTQQHSFPNAYAIVHSTKLCGATVAWFLVRELNKNKAEELLDLGGIATIADQMILKEANRSFAYFGIEALRKTERVGLQNLLQVAGIEQKDISTRTVNYAIGPRINAMGRIASALDALRALCTKDQQKSMELIRALQDTNVERQTLTVDMLDHAMQQAEDWKDEHLIVVASEEYHDGVIGLIAGKLVEEFAKPAIAISIGEKFAKASARSVGGVNVVELIRQVRDDLLEVGGHPMAAGFGLAPDKVEIVKKRLLEIARTEINEDLLQPQLTVESYLPIELLDLDLTTLLKTFEPFGNGNAEPIFGLQNVQVLQVYPVGKEGKHLKLVVRGVETGITLDCIGFGMGDTAEKLQGQPMIDLAGVISMNEWNGRQSVQMVVKDVLVREQI